MEPDADKTLDPSDFEPTEGFVYERADGTVEVALNAEDAIARCPVLGKLPVEQANVLLELAAVGQEKMAAQAKQAEEFSQPKHKPEPELANEVARSKNVQEAITNPTGEQTAQMHELWIAQQAELQHSQIIGTGKAKKETEPAVQVKRQTDQSVNADTQQPTAKSSTYVKPEKVVSQGQASESSLPGLIEVSAALPKGKLPETTKSDYKNERPAPPAEVIVADQIISVSEAYQEFMPTTAEITFEDYDVNNGLPEFVNIDNVDVLTVEQTMPPSDDLLEADVSRSGEVIFDDEVMDAFEQLIVIIDLMQEETPLVVSGSYETSTQDEVSLLSQELAEAIQVVESNVFEEFVMAKDPPEESPDIETVVAEADDRPLEETLAQLSFYLAETAETEVAEAPQNAMSTAIKEALRDLAEILPPAGTGYASQVEKPAITPEMTQKLLVLLRTVGYDEPEEVLVGFIKQHGFEFLLQAIRYLYQLSDEANRQEFLLNKSASLISVTDSSEPLTVRLGRSIVQHFFSPDPAILLS